MRLALLLSFLVLVFAVRLLALDGSYDLEKAELAKILGKKLKMFRGCQTIDSPARQKARLQRQSHNITHHCSCHSCPPPIAGNSTFMGTLGDQSFSYDLDENGYGTVLIMVDIPEDPFAIINFTTGDSDQYNEVTAVLDCMEYGWAGSEPELAFRNNAITCGADAVDPPCQCSSPPPSSTAASYPYFGK